MNRLESLAALAIQGHALQLRSAVQDWLAADPKISDEQAPASPDATVRAVAAGLAELFAERLGQSSPDWTRTIGPAPTPLYLVRSAARLRRLRKQCELESPLPLRRRHVYAPPGYLTFV